MPRLILALDQGTTSSRALLFDADGKLHASAHRNYPQYFPEAGQVEHDAREILASQVEAASEAIDRARAQPHDIAAVGLANQRETTVLWDRKTGAPCARAIVWQDRRTAARCEALRAAGAEADITQRSGLLLDPYFSATKLEWLLDSVPDGRSRAADGELAFGTVDSWLVWNLSGGREHVIDETNASRTLLYNIHTQSWDDALLPIFGVPRACLPKIVPSRLSPPIEIELRGRRLMLGGIAGDQQAAMVGQACFTRGMAKNTYGTGCFALLHTGEEALPSKHRLLTTAACRSQTAPCFALEGAVFVGGALVQWLRDELRIIANAGEIEPLARSVPDSGGVTFVPAFTGLGSPHWDPLARGMIGGLTRGSTRAHIARAALDAIALQSAEVLLAMQRDAGFAIRELRVDGGAAVNDLLMQTQADLLGLPVVRPQMTETTALGAAYLAGLAAGVWDSPEAIAAHWRAARVFEPALSRDAAESRLARWGEAVRRTRGWAAPGGG